MSFNAETRESARWLGEQFVTGLGQALEGMTGESFEVTSALAEREDYPSAEALWWDQPVSFPPNGRLVIGADATAWTAIGTRVLEAAVSRVESRRAKIPLQQVAVVVVVEAVVVDVAPPRQRRCDRPIANRAGAGD